jgi:hypothetical protein
MLELLQMALAKKPTDSFFSTEPVHPHLRLHLSMAILAVVVVSSAIWLYRVSVSRTSVVESTVPVIYPSSAEELSLIAQKISSDTSESPPTQKELENMALKMSKVNAGQETLSPSELELQAQILNQ